jgi:hypothetical protein
MSSRFAFSRLSAAMDSFSPTRMMRRQCCNAIASNEPNDVIIVERKCKGATLRVAFSWNKLVRALASVSTIHLAHFGPFVGAQ